VVDGQAGQIEAVEVGAGGQKAALQARQAQMAEWLGGGKHHFFEG
jgi:hypothetical protein